jgi:hypothetical protein
MRCHVGADARPDRSELSRRANVSAAVSECFSNRHGRDRTDRLRGIVDPTLGLRAFSAADFSGQSL